MHAVLFQGSASQQQYGSGICKQKNSFSLSDTETSSCNNYPSGRTIHSVLKPTLPETGLRRNALNSITVVQLKRRVCYCGWTYDSTLGNIVINNQKTGHVIMSSDTPLSRSSVYGSLRTELVTALAVSTR
jgi:hypothetical protein